jgi:hypothetical protein
MSRKMKVFISVLVAVLLLVGGTAVVMAQEDEEPVPSPEANGLLTRVAEILGIPEEDLIDAFQQARQEMMEERWKEAFYRALDKAVEEGLLTQEEADEIKAWWEQKPEALDLKLLRRVFSLVAPLGKHTPGVGQGMPSEIKEHLRQRMGQLPWGQVKPRPGRGMGREFRQPGPPWLPE